MKTFATGLGSQGQSFETTRWVFNIQDEMDIYDDHGVFES